MQEERTYRIGEAAKLLNLKTYVLRFWETEFSQLAPHRTEKGQRFYSEQDITLLRTIQHLLHERGLTIEGARKILAEQNDIMPPVGEGESLPPEAVVSDVSRPLYSEALTEAVISALHRTGQNGFGRAAAGDSAGGNTSAGYNAAGNRPASHGTDGDDGRDDEQLPDQQTIEAIVARVLAAGEGVPPDTAPATNINTDGRGRGSAESEPEPASDTFDSAAHDRLSDDDTSLWLPGIEDAGRMMVREERAVSAPHSATGENTAPGTALHDVIRELESLRELLSPRRFR